MAKPNQDLPLPPSYSSAETYISDLLDFVSTNSLHRLLTGGVHILDFFTRTPSLYETLLERTWREWFNLHDLDDLVYFILHEDMTQFRSDESMTWRNKAAPPKGLVEYISSVRNLLLRREPVSASQKICNSSHTNHEGTPKISHAVAMGMKSKKLHEVAHFASYVDSLAKSLSATTEASITHLVDFGSGQNYLGRTLASEPYNWNVIAVESKSHNVESARGLDVHAKLAPKTGEWVNKKEWRAQRGKQADVNGHEDNQRHDKHSPGTNIKTMRPKGNVTRAKLESAAAGKGTIQYIEQKLESGDLSSTIDSIIQDPSRPLGSDSFSSTVTEQSRQPSLMVISLHSCGNLSHHGIRSLLLNPSVKAVAIVGCCYNLLTESLTSASYKLPSLRPQPTPKSPLDPFAPELKAQPTTTDQPTQKSPTKADPHGFPMSHRFRTYTPATPRPLSSHPPHGIHLNITARMMAVQAPTNWTPATSHAFFTRHFYRALLQRVFLDCGVVEAHPNTTNRSGTHDDRAAGRSPAGTSDTSTAVVMGSYASSAPIVIGSLRKACYVDFASYVRGALAKLTGHHHPRAQRNPDTSNDESARRADSETSAPAWAPPKALSDLISAKTAHLSDADIASYEKAYAGKRKELGVVWTLMAFSAGVTEAAVVVDRWCWLRERMSVWEDKVEDAGGGSDADDDENVRDVRDGKEEGFVMDAWVEPVFDYGQSPRNLVVVGVKE